ncbi:MAG: flavodoxin family protein, partial [Selenomonadaceae bacterium]
MGKWLILYSTITGNTRMVAEAMLAAAPPGSLMQDIRDLDLKELRNPDYEVIAAGYWLKRGGPDLQMTKVLPQISDRQIVLFQTHGALAGSEHAVTAFARAGYLLGDNCEILGTFSCQGKINPRLLERR